MSETYDCVVTQISWERILVTLRVGVTPISGDEVGGFGDIGTVNGAVDGSAIAAPADRPVNDAVPIESVARDDDGLIATVADDDEPIDALAGDAVAAEAASDGAAAAGAVSTPAAADAADIPEDDGTLRFVLSEGSRNYPVDAHEVEDGVYDLQINITRFNGRRQVPNGTWRIRPVVRGMAGPAASYDVPRLTLLDDASRVFLYDSNKTAMTVSFGISEDEDRPEFLMRTYQLFGRSGSSKKKLSPVRRVKHRFTSYQARARLVRRVYGYFRRFARGRGNRVLFVSDQRTKIEGNLLRVRDRIVERGLDRKLDLRYSFRLPHTGNRLNTLRTLYLLATSDIVLLDDYFTLFTNLTMSEQTRVIQLWHAGSGFKAVGFSRFGRYGSPKLQNPHRQYTYAIAGSRHLVPIYAEAFGIEESAVIPTGLPRIDTFLEDERSGKSAERVYRQYPQLRDKRVFLFAPTFRGRGIRDAHYDYSQIDFDALAAACGPDAVVLFRMHHFVREPVPIPERHRDRFFDFGKYPDSNELLHVVDVLITDYSSIIYEFTLLDRPMLFYAPDKQNYAATRGFHRDYDLTAPGRVCSTFDEMLEAIRAEDYETWKIAKFREENFDFVDTHSADRVIDWLILGDPRELSARSGPADAPVRLPDAAPAAGGAS